MITQQQALNLENGQHVRVRVNDEWYDGLFIETHLPLYVSVYYIGYDKHLKRNTSIYGTISIFYLEDVSVPKKRRNNNYAANF